MPRLVGRHPHIASKGVVVISLFVAIAFVLELLGVIDLVPHFGRSSESVQQETQRIGGPYV